MIKKVFFLINLLIISVLSYSQSNENRFDEAKKLIEKREFYEANIILSEFLETDSLNVDAVKNYAYTLLKLNKNKNAEEYFNKAISLDKNCGFCYAGLAKIFYEYDINKAEKYLAEAEKIDISESYIYYVKALIKRKNKDNINAITEFSRALYFAPKNIDYLYERANTYLQISKLQEAINDYKAILEIEPNSPVVLYYLAYVYLEISDFNNSLKTINKAIEIDSLVPEYYNLKFSICYTKNDFYNAEEALLKSMEINPNDYNVYINLGDLYFQTGKYDAFCTSYNYALKIMTEAQKQQHSDLLRKIEKYCNESSLSYYFMRSQAEFLSHNYIKAREFSEKALIINNKNSLLYDQKASALLAEKKYSEATIAVENAIIFQENLLNEIKEFYAIELSTEQIISIKNSYIVKYQLQKAILETIRKEYDNSLKSLNNALDIASKEKTFPGLEYIHLAIAVNYLALNNNTLALNAINAAQEINPRNPVTTLYSAYYLLLSACSYKQEKIEYDYIEEMKLARIVLPELTIKENEKAKLQDAILLCDRLIEKYPNNPYIYIIKAKSMEMLSIPDYCEVAKIGKEKGLNDIFEELKIKCK